MIDTRVQWFDRNRRLWEFNVFLMVNGEVRAVLRWRHDDEDEWIVVPTGDCGQEEFANWFPDLGTFGD